MMRAPRIAADLEITDRAVVEQPPKIALDAGHGYNTDGKRTPPDKVTGAVTREWTMNSNVCNFVADMLKDYRVEIIRTDDVTGLNDTSLGERTQRINEINPALAISVHHNAATNDNTWGDWTGVEVFSHPNKPQRDADLAKLFVDEIALLTGLRNRGAKSGDLHMVRETNSTIPTVLTESGFMDSNIDYPVITSRDGQQAYARALANICIAYLGLQKK